MKIVSSLIGLLSVFIILKIYPTFADKGMETEFLVIMFSMFFLTVGIGATLIKN